jgi:putative membrane protein
MRMIVSTVAVVALLGAVPALAAVSGPDNAFATEAAYGGLAEVQMGQLALQKAASPQVKQFAQRMVTDHTQANQDLMSLSRSENLNLPRHAAHGSGSQGDGGGLSEPGTKRH